MFYAQGEYAVRFEWGERGVDALASQSDAVVIVDVLSFSTCVDVATARGAAVVPYPWSGSSAEAHAREHGAILASKTRGRPGELSLSPSSLLTVPRGTRFVLPSPNGSALSLRAAPSAATFTACLRNAAAVATRAKALGGSVAVIACGERWDDGSLRPSFEDLLGAGAIIERLEGERSPEALAAAAVFNRCRADLPALLRQCASGKELVERGFEADVALAGELDVSRSAPLLRDGCYVDAGR